MVYEVLKREINTNILAQGEKIVAREVAKQLGVSDIPVREALKKLESEGLVENIPHVGSRVSEINLQTAREIFSIRLELEAFATRLATKNASTSEIDELQEIVDAINLNIQNGTVEEFCSLNTEFHQRLYRLSKNETLCELILSLMDRSQYSRSIFKHFPERKEHSNEEHQLIVDALRRGNEEEAEKILRKQKKYSFEILLDKFEMEKKGKNSK